MSLNDYVTNYFLYVINTHVIKKKAERAMRVKMEIWFSSRVWKAYPGEVVTDNPKSRERWM